MKDNVNRRLCELLGLIKDWELESNKLCNQCPAGTPQHGCLGPCIKWSEMNSLAQKQYTPLPDFFSPSGRIDLLKRIRDMKELDNFFLFYGEMQREEAKRDEYNFRATH